MPEIGFLVAAFGEGDVGFDGVGVVEGLFVDGCEECSDGFENG